MFGVTLRKTHNGVGVREAQLARQKIATNANKRRVIENAEAALRSKNRMAALANLNAKRAVKHVNTTLTNARVQLKKVIKRNNSEIKKNNTTIRNLANKKRQGFQASHAAYKKIRMNNSMNMNRLNPNKNLHKGWRAHMGLSRVVLR
jgi:hypothetical protein